MNVYPFIDFEVYHELNIDLKNLLLICTKMDTFDIFNKLVSYRPDQTYIPIDLDEWKMKMFSESMSQRMKESHFDVYINLPQHFLFKIGRKCAELDLNLWLK